MLAFWQVSQRFINPVDGNRRAFLEDHPFVGNAPDGRLYDFFGSVVGKENLGLGMFKVSECERTVQGRNAFLDIGFVVKDIGFREMEGIDFFLLNGFEISTHNRRVWG